MLKKSGTDDEPEKVEGSNESSYASEEYDAEAHAHSKNESKAKSFFDENLLPKVAKILLYIYATLLPVFFLPITSSPIAANKEFLAIMILSIVFVLWLAHTIALGKTMWRRSFLNVSAFLIFLSAGVSAFFFSQSKWVSIFGFEYQSDTLIAFGIYFFTFFLFGQFFGTFKEATKVLMLMGAAYLFATLVFLFQTFGLALLPFDFAQSNAAFNTIGTAFAASLYIALGVFWGLVVFVSVDDIKFRIASFVGVVAGFLLLIMINFTLAFVGLLISIFLFLNFQFFGKGLMSIRKFVLPMVIFVLSLIYVLNLSFLSFGANRINVIEVSPLPSSNTNSIKSVLTGDISNVFFGNGPASFVYGWLQNRPIELNGTASLWAVRFSQGYSGLLTQFYNLGIIGFLILLSFVFGIIWFGIVAVLFLKKHKMENLKSNIFMGSFLTMVFILLCWFFYPLNFTLSVLLFAFLAISFILFADLRKDVASEKYDEKAINEKIYRTIDFTTSPQKTLIFTLILITLITFSVMFIYLEGQRYVAAYYNAKGNELSGSGDNAGASDYFLKATQNDAKNDIYFRSFSQVNLLRINELASSRSISQEEAISKFKELSDNAIESAKLARDLNPAEPFNWSMLGVVYENLISYDVKNGQKAGQDAYTEAFKLDPLSPLRAMDTGRIYMLSADQVNSELQALGAPSEVNRTEIERMTAVKNDHLAKAAEWLATAVALKPNYGPAHFLLAQVYDRQGKIEEAINTINGIMVQQPDDVGLAFQLGFLYYKNGQFDKAQFELERAVANSPNYSNARYFLGLIYDKKGLKAKAIDQFERIQQLNPDNAEVNNILKNLRVGSTALSNVAPPPPESRTTAPITEPQPGEVEEAPQP